ncbi:MAG TPA: amidohydrolase family protein [Pirellulaceae bacterium]|nr:amidohydrolase family protein [Pirellulaceae bacterium]
MIWDLHCHMSGVSGQTPDQRMAKLIEIADRMGVERFVFFMGYPWSQDPSPDDFRRQNDQVIEALTHWHHRAVGFAYLNPKHEEESLKEIDRCVKDGPLVGIKLWVAVRASDKRLDSIIRRAGELKAAIYQHAWLKVGKDGPLAPRVAGQVENLSYANLPGESTPMDLVELAARHPSVPIICGHTGGDWERGIRAVRASKNLSIDTGGSEPTAGFVEMAVRELGPERIIYGSDIGGRSFSSQLAKVTGADVSAAAKKLILGENLKRMLTPILEAKGMKP